MVKSLASRSSEPKPATGARMATMDYIIRPALPHERKQIKDLLCLRWYDDMLVVHDSIYYPASLPAIIAVDDKEIIGIVTYIYQDGDCEIVSLDSLREGIGIGTRLLEAVRQQAAQEGAQRLWLVTTNDNLHAIKFYQKRGFQLVKIDPHAVDRARKVKPSIPLLGEDDIPIRDEIELELILNNKAP